MFSDCTTCPKYSSRTQQHPNRKGKHVCLLLLSYEFTQMPQWKQRVHMSKATVPCQQHVGASWHDTTVYWLYQSHQKVRSLAAGPRGTRVLKAGSSGLFHVLLTVPNTSFLWFLFNILAQEKNYQKWFYLIAPSEGQQLSVKATAAVLAKMWCDFVRWMYLWL